MRTDELHGTVGFLLRAAWKESYRQFNLFFREYDFTSALYAVMVLVDRNPRCGVSPLAKALGIKQTNLVHLVNELIERKLLTRTTDPHDKRARALELTQNGIAQLKELRKVHQRYEKQCAQMLGENNMEQLRRILALFPIYPD